MPKYEANKYAHVFHDQLSEREIRGLRVLDEASRVVANYEHAGTSARAWSNRAAPVGSAALLFNNRRVGTVEIRAAHGALLGRTFAFLLISVATGGVLAVLVYRMPVRVVGEMEEQISRLVDDLRRANEELERRAAECAALYEKAREAYDQLTETQDQLVEARKMEAVGRLAGGIAHEFNNLLTVIVGRSELLLAQLPQVDRARRPVELILKTANRAAGLTQQMLAFGRKQMLRPEVVDLNEVLGAAAEIFRSAIGSHVELTTVLAPALWPVRIDRAQMEQVLLNLALNARDAMPQGGRLVIETANVAIDDSEARHHRDLVPGRWIRLSVTDSGAGMDADTCEHLFEPFFTTKEPGKGSGLGLASAHGTVKQHGGHIEVQSAVGRGTTVRIYLPALEPSAVAITPAGTPGERPPSAKTILLVAREEELRGLAREILELDGYRVLEARRPAEALHLADEHRGRIELLMSDVSMPEMSGTELAQRVLALCPSARVLYISNYSSDETLADTTAVVVEKPFTPEGLMDKVREALGCER